MMSATLVSETLPLRITIVFSSGNRRSRRNRFVRRSAVFSTAIHVSVGSHHEAATSNHHPIPLQ